MEVTLDLPIQAPPLPPTELRPAARRQQQQSPVEPPPRSAFPPRPPARDAPRSRKSPPLTAPREGDRSSVRKQPPAKVKVNLIPGTTAPRSLLPVTERKSQEENKLDMRPRKVSDSDKNNVAPDGMSAGREGRQFTVANVGNNGRIFLRPSVRPPNQRYPQPNFVFPMTPPGTAGLDAMTTSKEADKPATGLEDSLMPSGQWTPSEVPTPPATGKRPGHDGLGALPQIGRRRALSDSTIPETSIARESDPGGFKVIITQPGDDHRPRTLEDLNPRHNGPVLNVAIPTWKMGTPRFTIRGTPLIRGSSYAPTEEFRSSSQTTMNRLPPRLESDSSRRPTPSPVNIPQLQLDKLGLNSPLSPVIPMRPSRTTYLSNTMVIEPKMFDALTFKPASDDRSIVRISPTTHAVTAATPPRLVAEITSTRFVDYELVSDFFLTFRSFLEPTDLLKMLIARLRWAVARNDEVGMVVRVRTFVALRHWILNYFMDDFVIEYELRVMFCTLLNDFVEELAHDVDGRKVQLKILSELKKCWRRVCAQYWDGDLFDASLGPDVPIAPGGIAGHRNASLDPSFYELWENGGAPQLEGLTPQANVSNEPNSFYIDVSRAGHLDTMVLGDRPGTPDDQEIPAAAYERQQASPISMASMDVISCSFPTKNPRFGHNGNPLGAHPVDPSSLYTNLDPIATTPRALNGKRVRPQQAHHKRNNSLTDSLREHTTIEKMLCKNMEVLMALPYAGSLVRGAMFPPTQAFVDVETPSPGRGGISRQTTVFQPHPLESNKEKASAMSSQGMKKLLGSVRRALSTRGQVVSPTQGTFINISPIGPRGATTNRLPGTAIVPQACPRAGSSRPAVRIDLLGAEVSEDFKKAVREDAAAEAAKPGFAWPVSISDDKLEEGEREQEDHLEYSAAHMDSFLGELKPPQFRTFRDTDISTGSKSIVIVDDTAALGLPAMSGALPAVNSSVEAFAASLMPPGVDPTPPNTPPGQHIGTPRKSSVVLGDFSEAALPPVSSLPPPSPLAESVPAAVVSARDEPQQPPTTAGSSRPALSFLNQSPRRPPLSGVRGHTRQRSSRSYRSTRSMGRRRYASFTSGTVPYSTARSFDATTYSDVSVDFPDDVSDVPMPQPLRVLRRRPGGDLRAVNNIGDLDMGPLRRSHSVGSLTTLSDSMRSSYIRSPGHPNSSGFVDVVTSDYSNDQDRTFSLGAIAEHNPKRQLSLFSTHSSKPVMRPSFEAEAKKLKEIPDDADDDGGVESALLKLEGRFEKKLLRLSMEPIKDPAGGTNLEEKRDHRHQHVDTHGVLPQPLSIAQHAERVSHRLPSLLSVPPLSMSDGPERDGQSFLSEASPESYCSVPILERGLADNSPKIKRTTGEWTNHSIYQEEDDMSTPREERPELISQHSSYEIVKKTESMEKIAARQAAAAEGDRPGTSGSFLDDDSDAGSDLSSELSIEFIDRPLPGAKHTRSDTVESLPAPAVRASQEQVFRRRFSPLPEPLRANPPSPPMTLVEALRMSPETALIPEVHDHQVWENKPLPPTPDTSPTAGPYAPGADPSNPTGTKTASIPSIQDSKLSAHLPFILAFESEVLAQQFTLIEKDALNEIDWRELIEMRWKNLEHNDVRSWVDFLRNSDARGVEVVVARFNIMVKWAISEIVLTQDLEERARCIIKYIHIAAHARRYRNFATMSQIAMALTSNEITRLTKTWALIPPSDMRTLKELEVLVSPTRNFYSLRAEMEVVGITNADQGCIPFVGIYTHDLLFNAQKPSEIASSPTTAPLVNFERCRCAASVVKTLLRLLEASTLYTFQPIEGITERCLWMSALSDDEIRRLSQALC